MKIHITNELKTCKIKPLYPTTIFLLLSICFINAQVGINTLNPQATLDIVASDANAPSLSDGVLIPRVRILRVPTESETIEIGMLVYLTVPPESSGLYHWDGSEWISLNTQNINDLKDGKTNTRGSSIFIGENSGANDDGGSDNNNLGLGFESLKDVTTGKDNIALGYRTLSSNIIGYQNIAIGNYALNYLQNSLIAPSNNVAIGHLALSDMERGLQNVALGGFALRNFIVGDQNTSIGHGSANDLINGNNNVFLGHQAARDISDGNYNTFLGHTAGAGFLSGNDNVIIGNRAGESIKTGTGNVIIGRMAGPTSLLAEDDEPLDLDNKLYINNSESNLPLIYGDFDNNELKFNALVGINHLVNSKPKYNLHIKQEDNTPEGMGGLALERSGALNFWKIYNSADGLSFVENGVAASGAFINSAGALVTNSDRRLKNNISLITDVLPNIKNLKTYTYTYKHQEASAKRTLGFMAQDVQEVYPELVTKKSDGYLSLNYTGFSVLAIKAIQEVLVIINAQQEQINAQNQELKTFKEQLEKLK